MHTKRDLSSALTLATPILEKTISSTKIRSKSSISQMRRKTIYLREVLKMDLENFITDEDNIINFTEITVQQENIKGRGLDSPNYYHEQ